MIYISSIRRPGKPPSLFVFCFKTGRICGDRICGDNWIKKYIYIPIKYILVIVEDFNYPLQKDLPYIGNHDPGFDNALQFDRYEFQQMIRDLSLIAVHCRQKYIPIFLYGTHQTRIDFVFMRSSQIRWKQMSAIVDCRFECIGLHQGPQHRPLLLDLPKWHAIRKIPPAFQTSIAFKFARKWSMTPTPGANSYRKPRAVSSTTMSHVPGIMLTIDTPWNLNSGNCVLHISPNLSNKYHRTMTRSPGHINREHIINFYARLNLSALSVIEHFIRLHPGKDPYGYFIRFHATMKMYLIIERFFWRQGHLQTLHQIFCRSF